MPALSEHPSIVILGAGFGGIYTARHLEKLLKGKTSAEVVLIDRHNYFLMTPLLFEAGSGVLEPRHAVSPIRKLFTRVRFVQADVQGVDFERRMVQARPVGGGEIYDIPYDHLVVALGGVVNTAIVPGADRAMTFKFLADAIRLRNHAIELFERADTEPDARRKQRMLTFVIAGGGLVGVELVGELTAFLDNLSRSYPHIDPRNLRVELIEGGRRLMPEMDESLANYATRVLEKRGVRVRNSTRVRRIDFDETDRFYTVHLPEGEPIEAATVVVSIGVRVNPVIDGFSLEKDEKGRVLTDATMRSKTRPEVWALGDCAHVPDPEGKPYPQLAQHALRQAKVLARNIVAAMRNEPLTPFVYQTKGTLAALGHLKGVGRIGRFKVRGFIAWWIWRSYYLMQMPRWNRRVRIIFDWTIALIFKNDIVELDVQSDAQQGAKALSQTEGPLPTVEIQTTSA